MNAPDNAKREKLMRILEALFAKADPTRGGTEAECKAAIEKAHELMTKHGIEEAELGRKPEASDIVCHQHKHPHEEKARYRSIYHVLVTMTGIKCVRSWHYVGNDKCYMMLLFGLQADIDMALFLFDPIDHMMHRMPAVRAREQGVPNDRAFRNAYYEGAMTGILEANHKVEEKVKASCTAAAQQSWGLVVAKKGELITKHIQEAIKTKPGRATSRKTCGDGRSAGYRDGKNLSLKKALQ